MTRNWTAGEALGTDHRKAHNMLETLLFNVKDADYGAIGDGVTDDTTAIQAAITAMTSGDEVIGTLFFPKGVYKISNPIVLGNGSQYVSVAIVGQEYYSASNGPISTVILKPTDINEDAIQFNQWASHVSSVQIRGIQVQYASRGTGIGFNMAVGAETTGPVLENCLVQNAGVGFKIGTSVNAHLKNCSANACTKGMVLSGSQVNVASFDNCYFQACITSGLSVECPVVGARFASCVFQSNTGPGVDIISGATCIQDATFDTCWWEFPGTDMIRVSGVSAGRSLDNTTFIGCHFDGSNGAGGRHVINISAAGSSGVFVDHPVFINCNAPNLNGGYFLYTATDPTGSSDPGFLNVVIIGAGGGKMKGIHTAVSGLDRSCVFMGNADWATLVENSTVYGTKPRFIDLGGIQRNPAVRSDIGAIRFTELASDPTAPSANEGLLFAKDNGSGKTQFVARFNSGATQVIATEP